MRKLRMGMVGGGKGAFIGSVHRMAATLDNQIELVCGAFSSDPQRSKESGAEWMIPPDRVYGSYQEMLVREIILPADKKMDFVCIVTPNSTHFPIAAAALDAGFHVMCDKPMTFSLDEATALEDKVEKSGLLFGLTHNYTGYPMVKQAREMVKIGKIGAIRRLVVEYPQGWMATDLESTGQKQASWRVDPKQAGASFTMGDIGTHCANLAEYISGLQIDSLCSSLHSWVPGRKLDDDGSALLKFSNGATGVLWASGIAIGEENGLNIRIYGQKGALAWRQEEPNSLIVRWLDQPMQILRTNTGFVSPVSTANSRLPAGHPEGFIEAFANLYRNFAAALHNRLAGKPVGEIDCPNVHDGVRGMAFIKAVVESSAAGGKWTKVG